MVRFRSVQVNFTLRNDSHVTSIQWTLRSEDSDPYDPPVEAIKPAFIGRTRRRGTLLPQECITVAYLIICYDRPVAASLGEWVIDWTQSGFGKWRDNKWNDNTDLYCRFNMACDLS
jgi:hypothetical protein